MAQKARPPISSPVPNRAVAPVANVPPELVRQLHESAEDLRGDRIDDTGAFLARMRAKIATAIAAARQRQR
jgi:hypothetical protein